MTSKRVSTFINTKTIISFAICMHPWYSALFKITPRGLQTSSFISIFTVLVWLCRAQVRYFCNQIQSEYHGFNISVSIEGIVLEHYKQSQQDQIGFEPSNTTISAVFQPFFQITANNILPLHIYTVNHSLNF